MSNKVEIRFNEQWAVGPRSKGSIAFIIDPVDGSVKVFQYEDGEVVGKVQDMLLDELAEVVEKGRKAYDDYRVMEKEWLESEEGKAYAAKGKP